jgi:tetratricopeptide (TPR) repeat protein
MKRRALTGRTALAIVMLLLAATGLSAETVRVRSGEHGDFTRLVFDLGKPVAWAFGRGAEGYELRLEGPQIRYRTTDIFRRIPRERLRDVAIGPTPGTLQLMVREGVYAIASEAEGGRLVVDIRTGSAPADSPFERVLGPQGTAVDGTPQMQAPSDHAGGALVPSPTAPPPDRFRDDPESALPFLWRADVLQDASKAAGAASLASVPLDALSAARDPGQTDGVAPPAVPSPVEQDTSAAGHPPAAWSSLAEIAPSDLPMIGKREDELLRQLSRAAAQGLVTLTDDRDVAPVIANEDEAITGSELGGAAQDLDGSTVHRMESDPLSIETAMDRDMPMSGSSRKMTVDGGRCVPGSAVDIAAWGTDAPADRQISEARSALVGEFDRPDLAAVESLARLYIFLGMGAEARQVLQTFGAHPESAGTLHDIARLVDGIDLPAESQLSRMAGCDGAIALWAFLGSGGATADANTEAILLAFSALPGHLRLLLGERLAEQFLAAGNGAAARAVLNATARAGPSARREVAALAARIGIEGDSPEQAEGALLRIATSNDPLSRQALAQVLASRLARNEAIEPALIEAAAALAFEHRSDPQGAEFAHMEILARARSGALEQAFAAYERWQQHDPAVDKAATLEGLLTALAEVADDWSFARLLLAFQKNPDMQGISGVVRLKLAGRLNDLGFAREAEVLLAGVADDPVATAIEKARAAIARFEPALALRVLEGVEGAAADGLVARASSMLGRHETARAALLRAGDMDAAAEEAWRAGNAAIASGHPRLGAAVAQISAASASRAQGGATKPSLQQSREAAASSLALRDAIASLLEAADASPDSDVGN